MNRRKTNAEKLIDLREEGRDVELYKLMSTPGGRDLIWWLYEEVFMAHALPSGPCVGPNPEAEMAFREGRQSSALHLRDRARRACHEQWLLMLAEKDGPPQMSEPPKDENWPDQAEPPASDP